MSDLKLNTSQMTQGAIVALVIAAVLGIAHLHQRVAILETRAEVLQGLEDRLARIEEGIERVERTLERQGAQ
ncbi:MAG: hypothetical protein CL489_06870 [Acidobacteria bacterium]|nr:hypothetical protein [Acidobacteriota bacterium]